MDTVYKKPLEFDPDRFLRPEELPKHAFTPGGVGSHSCPGLPTGKLVAKRGDIQKLGACTPKRDMGQIRAGKARKNTTL